MLPVDKSHLSKESQTYDRSISQNIVMVLFHCIFNECSYFLETRHRQRTHFSKHYYNRQKNIIPESFSVQRDPAIPDNLGESAKRLRTDRINGSFGDQFVQVVSTDPSCKPIWNFADNFSIEPMSVAPAGICFKELSECVLELSNRTFISFCDAFFEVSVDNRDVTQSFLAEMGS